MKSLRGIIVILLIFACGGLVKAQDIHFSQYDMSPLTLNPALTGAYEGTFRIGGIYRDQWSSVLTNQYVTPAVFLDAPIIRGFGKNDWFGAGVVVSNDQAGSAALNNLTALASISYHLGLGKKSNTVFSLGGQGGFVQKTIDQNELLFEDELISGTTSQEFGLANFESSVSYLDFNVGGLINSYLSSKFNFYVGASAFHVSNPDDAFLSDGKLKSRILGHAGFNYDLSSRLVLSPTFLFQTQAKAREAIAEAKLGYHINPERNVTLYSGLGYRLGDAAILMIGMDYKGLKAGIAYDVNTSSLTTASRGRGAYELALSYTAKIYKTPVVKPVLFCPRF